jgi:hypothetical protein
LTIRVFVKAKGGETHFDVGRKSSMQVGELRHIKHAKVPPHGGKHLFYFCYMKIVFFPMFVCFANVSNLKE